MGQSIPVLENEIARLQKIIYNMEDNHDIALAELKEEYERRIEGININFLNEREREERDFIQRMKALSKKQERQIQCVKTEKNDYEAQIREEVTHELQGEMK